MGRFVTDVEQSVATEFFIPPGYTDATDHDDGGGLWCCET